MILRSFIFKKIVGLGFLAFPFTTAFNPSTATILGWSEAAIKQARDLSITQREKLKAEGALGIDWPIKIKAQRIDSIPLVEEDIPGSVTKVVHFQRHGHGYHNLLGEVYRELGNAVDLADPNPATNPFVRPDIVDSPLTEKGCAECAAQRAVAAQLRPELLVVSPLQRTLQTAALTWADHRRRGGAGGGGEGGVPWVAHEGCREELGFLVCNRRRPLARARSEYPDVDFALIESEEDTLWDPRRFETAAEKARRAYAFMEFLRGRPEREVAVVSHSAWLFHLTNAVVDCGGDPALDSWFLTSEVRSLRVTFLPPPPPSGGGGGGEEPTRFFEGLGPLPASSSGGSPPSSA